MARVRRLAPDHRRLARFRHVRSGGLPGGLGSAPDSHPTAQARRGPRGSTAWKIGPFGGGADDDAVALDDSKDREESCRSRAGPYAGGESPATALAAPPDPIYPLRSSRREQVADRRPARCAAARSVTTVWLGRSDCSRRDTRQWVKRFGSGPIGGGGDSPLTHRAPGYRHDVHGRADQISRRRHRQHARGRAVFPRRRTGAKSQPTPSSLRQGAPVNRRYGHVEDALIWKDLSIVTWVFESASVF